MIRKYEDYVVKGYNVPDGYRLLKRADTHRHLVYLDALFGHHSTAYLIAWWYPKTDLVRLRVWRSAERQHQAAIGELPFAFAAQCLQTHNIQLMPVNNAFWRGLGLWAFDECYQITAGRDEILNTEQLTREFYGRKRMMIIHRYLMTSEIDCLIFEHRKVLWDLGRL